jgi:hypothetical protein
MGLKGYRLWSMGQLDSTCRAPPRRREGELQAGDPAPRCSAAGCIRKANFETGFFA